ncbi:D-alanyl-D-alanine carboxypeptidase family protein [Ketogulonicigenium vulgare]|uniref:serine-type D-Ala-D-Ala carboxypeptidase n=1 Tax=Ketogulonicigenium vulgare (strain WSH-001) TaxID=759362 RepID=F9Y4S5_KETVW|nr:D-alanyl-D-alanine carboxypeptidase family protein [Ketogulonicigenium vulgare]AEM41809.1 D-alanyl-D-alanine carboxypeptidase family protein [Ketogulonicigenium vulgare WSH-001]ALJ81916.1 D-alanyl-D-alanine carboxypeptidase [Ketogulonicigenium vulgare]ANW34563.1 D-alanyl-D-alanine carboxypeptidase [Ketogulonicigenium vulgare]
MSRKLNTLIAGLAVLAMGTSSAMAQSFVTSARAAYVLDQTTGTVLLDHNADEVLPPASMSKLMTIYMAFEAVSNGRLHLTDELRVSQHCMNYGGSSMFLNTQDRPHVEDLLRGVIILSGNDASCVLAEALSPDGTEGGFAALMTTRAHELGMSNSHFMNSNGWPAAGHLMSMRDLGTLSRHLIEDFPTFYPIFAETEFHYDGRVPSNSQNRNPILSLGIGADGLKTGHTSEAGYGLAGSARQGDRRVIFVITGLESEAARRDESERIINWAFRQFALQDLGKAGDIIPGGTADVWMGAAPRVQLALGQDLQILVPTTSANEMTTEVVYNGPIAAPITAGQELATLVIDREGMPQMTVPLVAETDVPAGGFVNRVMGSAMILLGKVGGAADQGA